MRERNGGERTGRGEKRDGGKRERIVLTYVFVYILYIIVHKPWYVYVQLCDVCVCDEKGNFCTLTNTPKLLLALLVRGHIW